MYVGCLHFIIIFFQIVFNFREKCEQNPDKNLLETYSKLLKENEELGKIFADSLLKDEAVSLLDSDISIEEIRGRYDELFNLKFYGKLIMELLNKDQVLIENDNSRPEYIHQIKFDYKKERKTKDKHKANTKKDKKKKDQKKDDKNNSDSENEESDVSSIKEKKDQKNKKNKSNESKENDNDMDDSYDSDTSRKTNESSNRNRGNRPYRRRNNPNYARKNVGGKYILTICQVT